MGLHILGILRNVGLILQKQFKTNSQQIVTIFISPRTYKFEAWSLCHSSRRFIYKLLQDTSNICIQLHKLLLHDSAIRVLTIFSNVPWTNQNISTLLQRCIENELDESSF
jgi:hypothetical protein